MSHVHRLRDADRLTYTHMNPVRKKLVTTPEQSRWSSRSNFSLDVYAVKACPIAVDKIVLPETYRA